MFKKILPIIVLVLLSIFSILNLFNAGLPNTHDGQDHVVRIASFYKSLSEGNIVPRWASNLNWGYGHPVLMFLYPLPSYFASFFHFLGFNLVDSLKIVFGISFVASGIGMYIWLKEFLDEKSSFVGSILYIFAPYRFIDMYVRGALGEHVAFVFIPIVLFFVMKINKDKKFNFLLSIGLSVSLAGLILSHNAISLMLLPFIFAYILYLFYQGKNIKFFLRAVSSIMLGFVISAFFWVPAFLEGKYTLRDIVTGNEALTRFVDFRNIIYSTWSYAGTGQFSVQLGILQWIVVLFFPFVAILLFKNGKNFIPIYFFTFIYFILSLFLMLSGSSFIWNHFTILEKFQFPWRFLSVSVFTSAILGAFFVSVFPDKLKSSVMIVIAIFAIFFSKDYLKAQGYVLRPESFYTSIYNGTTDTGESSPIWSVRFMENRPKDDVEIIDGKAKFLKISKTSINHKYEINVESSSAGIRENTVFFPGWKVYIDGKENRDIQFQDGHNRGVIVFYVEKGKHIVNVVFEDTGLRKVANIISISGILFLIFYYVLYFYKIKLFKK